MIESIATFIKALDAVPTVLLTVDDARVLTDARTSAGVLNSIESLPMSVVFVGATGVGKSYLVNDLVGMIVSESGVLRPTTKVIVMAGSSGPVSVDHASEYVLAPDAPDGIAIVDTPAPETDATAARASLASADVGILVVSPSRYADAATHEVWISLESVPVRAVVLNRMRGSHEEMVEIAASVRERFADATVLEVEEGGNADNVERFIAEQATGRPMTNEKAAIARIAATEAGRHIVGALTASAISLGALKDAVDEVPAPDISGDGLVVLESWLATEGTLVESVRRSVDELDRRIVASVGDDLGARVSQSLGRWESGPLEAGLDDWRENAAVEFRSNATVRFRRSGAEQLLNQASWRVGMNANVRVVKRVSRMMGSALEPVSAGVHDALVSLLNEAIEDRRTRWQVAVGRAGSFKPGELLAAVDELANQ